MKFKYDTYHKAEISNNFFYQKNKNFIKNKKNNKNEKK